MRLSILASISRMVTGVSLGGLLWCGLAGLHGQTTSESGWTTLFYGIDPGNNVVNLADATGASRFYSNGIYGQNTTSWVVDAQLAGTNLFPADKFTNVAYTYDPRGVLKTPGEHATWCAGLLGGYTAEGYYLNTGTAPLTKLGSAALATSTNANGSFSLNTDGSSTTNSLASYVYAASHGNVLSTSIGDSSDTAGLGRLSGLLDALAFSNPNTTMVAAAGNGGPSNGTVSGPASGYNTISVGALDGPTNYNVMATFSSRGPLETAWSNGTTTFCYGNGVSNRPGVDLVAPGTGIVMPVEISSNSVSYYNIAGTSFATPLVAGGAALLDSTANTAFSSTVTNAATKSEVIKAVLMNSADKLSGWNNGQQIANGVITTAQALDWAMGAGRLNLNTAFTQYTTSADITTSGGVSRSGFTDPVQSTGWAFGTAMKGLHNDYQLIDTLLSGQQIAVTLCWMRDRRWNAAISDFLDVAQAELNLMVYRVVAGVDQLVAQSISPVSTTQELYFPITDSGTYLISVGYFTNLFDFSNTHGSQDYGLAWSVSGAPSTSSSVPEPSSWLLFSLGACIVAWRIGSSFAYCWQPAADRYTKES